MPKPDIVTPKTYAVSGPTLYAAMTQVAENTPRTFKLVAYEGRYESAYRGPQSKLLNFPDTDPVQDHPDSTPPTAPSLLYSASRYGDSDFGVNRARVEDWLSRLNQLLGASVG